MGRTSGDMGWTRLIAGFQAGKGRRVETAAPAAGREAGEACDAGACDRTGDMLARLARLERSVARLPLFEREIWWLAARDDLTSAEIADRLGIGVAEVETYLASAIVALADGQGDG